jgi:hypothetical protein
LIPALTATRLARGEIAEAVVLRDGRPRANAGEDDSTLFLFDRFGVNRDAVDLRKLFFDAIFEGGGDVVNFGDGQGAAHGAMARRENVMLDLTDADVVAVHQFVEFGRERVEELLDGAGELLHFAGAGIRSSDMATERLDVNVHVG